MSNLGAPHNPAFDPFGEPMDLPGVCTDPKGYGETRRAALVFWVLALVFVGGRIYLSTPPVVQDAATALVQVAGLR